MLEIYRRFLAYVLLACVPRAKPRQGAARYSDSASFVTDLVLVRDSLDENGGGELAEGCSTRSCFRWRRSDFICIRSTYAAPRGVHARAIRTRRGLRFDGDATAGEELAAEKRRR